MGMTIEEMIKDIKNNVLPFDYRESLQAAIEIMEKYQKIQTIVNAWNDMNSFDSMANISEVLKDGND